MAGRLWEEVVPVGQVWGEALNFGVSPEIHGPTNNYKILLLSFLLDSGRKAVRVDRCP
jgi:hypothetical protein